MDVLAPLSIFVLIFGGALVLTRRTSGAIDRLARHEIAAAGPAIAAPAPRTPILGGLRRTSSLGELAEKATPGRVRSKSAKLLREAGDPMPLATYLLFRIVMTFVMLPLMVLFILQGEGTTPMGIGMVGLAVLVIPNLIPVSMKRRARKRARAIEMAMPDAMDLLVVCVEGGLSLDGGVQQIAQRTDGVLAGELRRLQGEITTGMGRREAFQGLVSRSRSQSLAIFATAIVQADKMGTSIGETLRTLADSMRTRRRQAAETQARKAPIKMLPFLVAFMIPSLFIVILGPTVLAFIEFFRTANG
ncbi:MAG TPA: type II secretion system F family protein [Thermomicrobiales bacterium]|jgi:tight adherence protein C